MPIIKSIKKFFGDKNNEEGKKRAHERLSSNTHSYSPTPIASPNAKSSPNVFHKGAKKAEHQPAKKNVSPSHVRHYSSPSSRHPPHHSSHHSTPKPDEVLPATAMAIAKAQLNEPLVSISDVNPEEGFPVYKELTMPVNLTDDDSETRFKDLRRSRSVNLPLASLLSPNGDKHVRQDTDLFSPVTPQRSDTFHDQRLHLSMLGA